MNQVVCHWWMQRVTGGLMIPLSLWFLWKALPMILTIGTDELSRAFFTWKSPTFFLGLFLACSLYHGSLGIQTIIEDYVPMPKQSFYIKLVHTVSWGMGCLAIGALLMRGWF